MKRKTLVVIGAIVITIVLGGVLYFVLKNGEKQQTESVSFQGTWLVFQRGEHYTRDEFMVFTDARVSYYKGEEVTPVASSAYSVKDEKLITPEIERSFTYRKISDNNIEMIESNTIVWRLLLVGDADVDRTKIVPKNIEGIYDVKVVGEKPRQGETMAFTDSHLSFVQGSEDTISSDYFISDDGILHLTTINRDYYLYMNGDNLLFIGSTDNSVWELQRAKSN